MKDKVDHPRKGSKDLADAVCGSIYNAISLTRPDRNDEIKIHTYESMSYDQDFNTDKEEEYGSNMIRAPKMPPDLKEAMDRMMII
jgi:hypothetical protein